MNGDCDCLDGYLGTFCEARETDEYLGLFDAFRTCDPDEDVIDFEIRESQLDARKIYFDFDGLTIYAIAFPTEFTIPDQQFLNLYVIHETSGTKNGRVLDFEFSYTYLGIPSYSEICQFRIIQPN